MITYFFTCYIFLFFLLFFFASQTFKTCDTAVKKLKKELEEETEKAKAAQIQSLHHAKPYKNVSSFILY